MTQDKTISRASLEALVTRIILAAGSSEAEAQAVAANLVLANLSGHDSHGVGMVPRYVDAVREGGLTPNAGVKVLLDTGSLLSLDAQRGYGQVTGVQAMQLGIARAKQHGSCIMALANSHHLGRIGHFAEMAVAQGLVSIHFVNVLSRPVVAPWGGGDGRFGTNPCCIGVPLEGAEPFILDFATSRVAQGKMRVAHNKGEQVPPGYLIDAEGQPTTDPGVVVVPQANGLFGALMTFGEHKGFGMALACELLGGALTGGGTWHRPADSARAVVNSMLTILIDPARLGTQDSFAQEAEAFIAWLRESPAGAGHAGVQIAGEPERAARKQRAQHGIQIDAATWQELVQSAATVGAVVEVDTTPTLGNAALPSLSARGIDIPTYPRSGAPGVVHLGLGAFHRAHQALVFDGLLRQGDGRWGVLGVAMRSTELADALKRQDGLYAVQVASGAGTHWILGGALRDTCVAAREPAQVVQAIAAPSTRWVTLTVTEKGYTSELAALLVQGLAARHAAGLNGLTIASCDNLQHNGRRLQALCLQAAREVAGAPTLAAWIETSCAFPNSMVDRIVPAATPARLAAAQDALGVADAGALGTEAFWEWVIENRFVDPADGALLAGQGVTVVDDVAPFETAKLRMLNGSHTAMACMGAVRGLAVIGDCITEPEIRAFVHGLMTEEVGPQLQRPDWLAYRDALLARFANPALQHSVHQIATDSSQKIPQRWPPPAEGWLQKGKVPQRLAFASAVFLRYLRGVNEAGVSYALNDPMAAQLQALALAHAGDAAGTVQAIATLPAVWGGVLPGHEAWLAAVTMYLAAINEQGVRAALIELNAGLEAKK